MRYSADRPLWRQRTWWQDGLVFALLLPVVVNLVTGGSGPAPSPVLDYLLQVAAALAAWGLAGWVRALGSEGG